MLVLCTGETDPIGHKIEVRTTTNELEVLLITLDPTQSYHHLQRECDKLSALHPVEQEIQTSMCTCILVTLAGLGLAKDIITMTECSEQRTEYTVQ